jgi:hypothetical protein
MWRAGCSVFRLTAQLGMRVTLAKKWTDRLVKLPESGMGYQRVDIRFANDRVVQDVLVFNAEEAELPEDLAQVPIQDIQPHKR